MHWVIHLSPEEATQLRRELHELDLELTKRALRVAESGVPRWEEDYNAYTARASLLKSIQKRLDTSRAQRTEYGVRRYGGRIEPKISRHVAEEEIVQARLVDERNIWLVRRTVTDWERIDAPLQ